MITKIANITKTFKIIKIAKIKEEHYDYCSGSNIKCFFRLHVHC